MSESLPLQRLAGVVERVTYHNIENGWSVLRVSPFDTPHQLATVVIHQAKVFAGASMEFWGEWGHHPKHGSQFKAQKAVEKKPATAAALEKYLGSGLIKGVGPVTASRIVKFFKDQTLDVFENHMDQLMRVPGIAEKKLEDIKTSWQEHKSIRDVMLFLQNYGISTLFAVKIFKTYGNDSISTVSKNPYQLSKDIYGIGFFSADKIALSMGFERNGTFRIEAGIKHTLSAAREDGHCYLTHQQIVERTHELLEIQEPERLGRVLGDLQETGEIKVRTLVSHEASEHPSLAYYHKALFYDELEVARFARERSEIRIEINRDRIQSWVERYCQAKGIRLSDEQEEAVYGVVGRGLSILTGGPGCGKTTTTRVIVQLLRAMGKQVVLAAPTGRAAQRMTEVIEVDAKTLHRLLEVNAKSGGFKKGKDDPLIVDFLVVDECSMLDIQLTASLVKAIPPSAQVLLIGDPDQLPSVGAGNVLSDLLDSGKVAAFRLTKIFRQAEESLIIRYAHDINRGEIPRVDSPVRSPELWKQKAGCLFIDSDEATQEQLHFIQKAKRAIEETLKTGQERFVQVGDEIKGVMTRREDEVKVDSLFIPEMGDLEKSGSPVLVVPEKFRKADLEKLQFTQTDVDHLKAVLGKIHPWSSLHYGLSALDVLLRMLTKSIPEAFGKGIEVQILTPQVRGSLGTLNLNRVIQSQVNPERPGVKQLSLGDRLYREGDRVIQTRNNYDLGVYNGDIGKILQIDLETYETVVAFGKNEVIYQREDLVELSLAYAITIHKSQGSEFGAVIIPVTTQHFKMLFRNLIYTGLTRAKTVCVFVGSRKALALAIQRIDSKKRQTALKNLISD